MPLGKAKLHSEPKNTILSFLNGSKHNLRPALEKLNILGFFRPDRNKQRSCC